jgi:hypothetical protein
MKLSKLTAPALCLFAFTATLSADVYDYTGAFFTSAGGSFTTGMNVTATFTFSSPLVAGVNVETPTSWTVSAGAFTLSSAFGDSLAQGQIIVTADAFGNITDWNIHANDPGTVHLIISGGPNDEGSNSPNYDQANVSGTSNYGFVTSSAGAWVDATASATPEPGTIGVVLAGGILFFAMRRFQAKRSA